MCGNFVEMYSIHSKGKFVIGERFIGTLNSKIYNHMTVVSKTVYNNKLDEIVNKYNKTYSKTTKPADL